MQEEVTISPAVKFLFFQLLKSKKQYKDLKRELKSKIQFVTIAITEKKMFLRVKAENGIEMDKPFTEGELNSFLKALGVKEESKQNIKHILLLLNMEKREIKYDQTNKDGTKRNFVL